MCTELHLMTTVQIPDTTYETLRRLAGNGPIDPILIEAVEDLRRKRMLDETNAAFAAIEADPASREDLRREREELEGTIGDGLEGS
jgi:hypothetical protein